MTLLRFLFEFFKIGLFTYGGGLAMIPILRDVAVSNHWLSEAHFTDLIAISQATPGPIAINMATYIGFREWGILGAVLASIILVVPSFILAILLGNFLSKYRGERGIKAAFVGIKATIIGLIGTSVVQVALVSLYREESGSLMAPLERLDLAALLLLIFFFALMYKTQKHPIVYIVLAACIGVIIF